MTKYYHEDIRKKITPSKEFIQRQTSLVNKAIKVSNQYKSIFEYLKQHIKYFCLLLSENVE